MPAMLDAHSAWLEARNSVYDALCGTVYRWTSGTAGARAENAASSALVNGEPYIPPAPRGAWPIRRSWSSSLRTSPRTMSLKQWRKEWNEVVGVFALALTKIRWL